MKLSNSSYGPLDIRQHFFILVQNVAFVFSAITILVNLLAGYPMNANIKWLLLLVSSLCLLLYARKASLSNRLIYAYFLFFILVFLPFAFIDAGENKSNFTAFLFFGLILITYILSGNFRLVCLFLLLAVLLCLELLEYFYPELIPAAEANNHFFNRLIHIPLMLCLSYQIVKYFSEEFCDAIQKLSYYANHDKLTGLLNRWALGDMLASKFPSSEYKGYLAFLDIDNFKRVNDNKGHIAGDEVLRKLGCILRENFGGDHLVCRWGGDEFIIFFFDKLELLDKAIGRVTKDFLTYIDRIEPGIDLSIGFSSLEGCRNVEDVFVESDRVMYAHKKSKQGNYSQI